MGRGNKEMGLRMLMLIAGTTRELVGWGLGWVWRLGCL